MFGVRNTAGGLQQPAPRKKEKFVQAGRMPQTILSKNRRINIATAAAPPRASNIDACYTSSPTRYTKYVQQAIMTSFPPTTTSTTTIQVEAPVLNREKSYPAPLGLFLHTRELFTSLPLADRASMIPLLYAVIDVERDEKTYREYDKMTARELFRRFGISERC